MSTFRRRLIPFAGISFGILLLLSTSANAALPGTYQGWIWETALGHQFGFGLQEEYCFSQFGVTVNGDLTWTAAGTDEVCWGRTTTNSNPPRAYDNYNGTTFLSTEDFLARSTRSLVSAGGNLYELFGEDVVGGMGEGEERLATVLSEPTGDNLLIIGGTDSFSDAGSREASRFVDVLVKSTPVARVAADLVGKWHISSVGLGLSGTDVNLESSSTIVQSFELMSSGACSFSVPNIIQDPDFTTNFAVIFAAQFNADGGVNLTNRGVTAGIGDSTRSACTYGLDGSGYLSVATTITQNGVPRSSTLQFVVSDDNNYLAWAPDPDGILESPRSLLVGYREPSTAMTPSAIDGTYFFYLVLNEFEATGTGHSFGQTGGQEVDSLGRGSFVFDSLTAATTPTGQTGNWFSCDIDLTLNDTDYAVDGEPLAGTVSFSSQSEADVIPFSGCAYTLNADGGLLVNLSITDPGEPTEEILFAGYTNHNGELINLFDLDSEPHATAPAPRADYGSIRYILGMKYTGNPEADADGDQFTNFEEFKIPLAPPPPQNMSFSYTFVGQLAQPFADGAELTGIITGSIDPADQSGDTVLINSFEQVTLFRPGLPPFQFQQIDASEFNSIPAGTPPVMSFSGLTLNFRACHNGFTEDSGVGFPDDCPFALEGGFGITYNINPPGGWASAADGSGNTAQCSGGGVSGCRVTDMPIVTARWNLRVHLDGDYDGDGVLDGDDAFPADPSEWDDTDGDGTGNNTDTDDDGDGIPDDYEIANGLDPLNAADAAEDADGDGFTNLEEFEAGTDPQDAADFPSPRMAPVSIFILLDDEG